MKIGSEFYSYFSNINAYQYCNTLMEGSSSSSLRVIKKEKYEEHIWKIKQVKPYLYEISS